MENAIEIKNLTFSYQKSVNNQRDIDVLENLSINFPLGKYTCVLGHNGSGKSTLAKIIVGLLSPTTYDSIKVLGLELNEENISKIRETVGIVFQNPDNQFIGSTVEDDIAFGLENRQVAQKEMKAIIDEYATLVGMNEYLTKEPSHLSGGQKQRVAIAGILAMKPKILILDEATSMLDPKGKKEIKQLIHKMKEIVKDITIISISHDVEEALMSDYIVILNKGKLYKSGSPKEIFQNVKELEELYLDAPFAYKLHDELTKLGIKDNHIEELLKDYGY
ncbi:MAG: energy-coupling factor transporter ATPase [Bacilli bacterium]|nr:energy-coupling factor transporter ATPase [Bacilli bacterium]